MPTEEWFKANPKVSAYTSQAIYERLKQFATERRSSISQALTVVLAEYFAVDQEVDRASVGGVTLAQFQKQKEELDKLSELVNQKLLLVEQRFAELENRLELKSSLEVDHSKLIINSNTSPTSKLVGELDESNVTIPEIIEVSKQDEESSSISSNSSELLNKLLGEEVKGNTQAESHDTSSNLQSKLKSKLINVEVGEIAPNTELIDETRKILSVQPLSGGELGQRLGVDQSAIARYKNGKRKQSLAEWSKNLDPKGIAWGYSKELKKYVPSESLPSSSKNSLQIELLIENQDSAVKPQTEEKVFNSSPLTGEQLAVRLGVANKRSLDRQRTGKQAANFPEWTRSKDPDEIAWYYVKESKMYYSIKPDSKLLSGLLEFETSNASNNQVEIEENTLS